MSDIFISYANEDRRRIHSLVAALEAQGWSVFWDRTIPNGKTWRDIIGKGLRESRCVVVAWSQMSIESTWVQEEADEGQERGILHPVLIDEVKAPLGFRAIQAANLVGWNGRSPSPEFDRFLKDLESTLGPPRRGESPPPLTEPPPQKGTQTLKNGGAGQDGGKTPTPPDPRIMIALFLALVAIAVYWFWPPGIGPEMTVTGKDGAPMVLVPAGEFMMGMQGEEKDDYQPVHPVYLDAFYIDKYEVTTWYYDKFIKETKRSEPNTWSAEVVRQYGRKPVVDVDWNDATSYCAWAGKRLPTEAEWEKAARGMDQRLYPWGNEAPNELRATFGRNGDLFAYWDLTDVGELEVGKSPYGAYDMAGNVWEWVADWYGKDYYQKSPKRNPKGPSSESFRITRGGSWKSSPHFMRSFDRYAPRPTSRGSNDIGFRCAQDVPK